MKTVTASDFPACAAKVLKEVVNSGDTVMVTEDGRPIARLEAVGPKAENKKKINLGGMRGTAVILGDIVEPLFPDWDPKFLDDDQSA